MKQKYLLLVILKYPIHTLNSSVLSAPMTRTCALRAPPIKISKFLDLGEPNLLCEKVYITHLRTGITMLYSYNVHVLVKHTVCTIYIGVPLVIIVPISNAAKHVSIKYYTHMDIMYVILYAISTPTRTFFREERREKTPTAFLKTTQQQHTTNSSQLQAPSSTKVSPF